MSDELTPWEAGLLTVDGLDGEARYVLYRTRFGMDHAAAFAAATAWVANTLEERKRRRSHGVA